MEVRLSLNNNFDGLSARNLSTRRKVPSSYTHPVSDRMESSAGRHAAENILEKKSDFKNNINRPTESVSFSGSAVSRGSELINKMADSIVKRKNYFNLVVFSNKNEAKLKAALALVLAGILKPICVVAMPGADEDDKKFTATKNAISAVLGYALSTAILDPISYGVDKFIKNPEKYLEKDNPLIETFAKDKLEPFKIHTKEELKKLTYKINTSESLKTVYKNGLGILVAPLKAAMTIALMPYVLKFLFGSDKKPSKRKDQPPLYMEPLLNPMLNSIGENNKAFAMFIKTGGQK